MACKPLRGISTEGFRLMRIRDEEAAIETAAFRQTILDRLDLLEKRSQRLNALVEAARRNGVRWPPPAIEGVRWDVAVALHGLGAGGWWGRSPPTPTALPPQPHSPFVGQASPVFASPDCL